MPKPALDKTGEEDLPGENKKGEEKEDESLSELNSPALDEKTGKPKNRAVSSFKQAHSISKRQHDRAEEGRLKTAAVIADKYGGSSPYKQAVLKNSGQGWRNNFSTNPLAAIVDRATPQLKGPIQQAESLTYSALPSMRPNAAEKTRKFRSRITKLIRSWSGWEDFVDCVTQDNYLFGNSAPGWIDDNWRPRSWRTNEFFLPEGTRQHASKAQFITYRQPVLLHEFLDRIADPDTATAAGFNMAGCIKAANEAVGIHNTSNQSQFDQVDALREGAGGLDNTYEGETKIVWIYHLLVREYDGGVCLWSTAEKGGHAIRYQKDLHESMEDSATFFTLQSGNNTFFGSKGAGRMLTNMHIALDRSRNFNSDKATVAGLPIWQVKGKDINTVQMHFRAPFMFITGDATMAQEMVEFDPSLADWLDRKMSEQMEAIAGSFIPPEEQQEGTPSTKIADAERVKRQLAVKNGVLGRFFRHFGDLISAIQRKICRPENLKEAMRIFEETKEKEKNGIRVLADKLYKWMEGVIENFSKTAVPMGASRLADPEAVEALVDLLRDGLSAEDIAELALAPAANNSEEQPETKDAKTTELIGAVTQNERLAPYFNHKKMAGKIAKIQGGDDVAEELLLKDKADPNDQAVNTREELGEWLLMLQGDPVNAAQTDNHRIRRAVLFTKLQPILELLRRTPTPEMVGLAKLAVPHYAEHLEMDRETPPEALQGEIKDYQQMEQIVIDADAALVKLAEAAAKAGAGGDPNAMPPPMNGAPMGANGGGGTMTGTENEIERQRLEAEDRRTQADVMLRAGELALSGRKLALEERKQGSKEEKDATDAAIKVASETATKMAQAGQSGEAAGTAAAQAAITPPNEPSI